METVDITTLINECSYPCISIVLPSKRLSDLQKSADETCALLEKVDIPHETIDTVLAALNAIDENAFKSDCFGWGIYVSPKISGVVSFPFRVNKKVCIDQCFDTEYLLPLSEEYPIPAS